MRYWWKNAGIGTRLEDENWLRIDVLTGRLPILLNVVDKLLVKIKGQGGLGRSTIYLSS